MEKEKLITQVLEEACSAALANNGKNLSGENLSESELSELYKPCYEKVKQYYTNFAAFAKDCAEYMLRKVAGSEFSIDKVVTSVIEANNDLNKIISEDYCDKKFLIEFYKPYYEKVTAYIFYLFLSGFGRF